MKTDRRRSEQKGRSAELIAACYLISKGYQPMGWRVKTPLGEIDLVMRSRRTIVFVEVKTRHSIDAGLAAVTRFKAQRMLRAAQMWIARHCLTIDYDYRFDILVVSAYHWPTHIENAFGAELW